MHNINRIVSANKQLLPELNRSDFLRDRQATTPCSPKSHFISRLSGRPYGTIFEQLPTSAPTYYMAAVDGWHLISPRWEDNQVPAFGVEPNPSGLQPDATTESA